MIFPDNKQRKDLVIPEVLPLLPIRDVVIFPYMVIPLTVGREKSINALEEAMMHDRLIFLVTQKNMQVEDPKREDLYDVGTVVEVLQLLKIPDGTIKMLVEGLQRGEITEYIKEEKLVRVKINLVSEKAMLTKETEAIMRNAVDLFEQYVKLNNRIPIEAIATVSNIVDPGRLADVIASHILVKVVQEQTILETIDVHKRLMEISKILTSEIEILSIEKKIQGRVRGQIEKTQKEYYLHEQLKAIKKELNETDDVSKEVDEIRAKIKAAKMSAEATDQAEKELARLEKMTIYSPEATVIRTYIDWLIKLPWVEKTKDQLDIKRAEKILNEDHYGLDKAKERILEYLSVCKLAKKIKGPILCFVGPPGVGKTSLGRSVARAMERKFTRISLGGMHDEAEIRGHRRTYIGALPGRIIQSLSRAKSNNPVFLLDEIDKVGKDFRGDPSAALLEVLDPEQNNTFTDHYLEVEYDLSDIMFITTANSLQSIHPSLADRMEIVSFPGYTTEEKIGIATKYLIPKQIKENGLKENQIEILQETIDIIISDYTREAGVRSLEREIGNICRKVAREIAENGKLKTSANITKDNIHDYLGIKKYFYDDKKENKVGIATGLAWTEMGGDTLSIEVAIMKGKSKLTLTGKLGDIMQESAQAALSYIRANTNLFGLPDKFYDDKEIHIHVPEGAIPKDGPSAGIAIVTALLSAMTNRPVKKDLAMTGEITLRGRVLAIGGFKEKILAAHRAGIKTVIFPEDNKVNLEEIPKKVQELLELIPVNNIDEVIKLSLVKEENLKRKELKKSIIFRKGKK